MKGLHSRTAAVALFVATTALALVAAPRPIGGDAPPAASNLPELNLAAWRADPSMSPRLHELVGAPSPH